MKQKLLKRVTAVLSALVMGLVLIGSTPLTAKADSLAESVESMGMNAWYRALLEEQSRYSNQSNFKFDLVDVDNDGVNDLIMSYVMTDTTASTNTRYVQLWSYNKYITGIGGFVFEVNEIYYNTQTQYVKCVQNYSGYTTTKYGQLSNNEENYLSYSKDTDGNYVSISETGELVAITDQDAINTYNGWETNYMSSSVKAEGKYEKTEENLDKYLSLSTEVTTNAITLKVGEAFGVSYDNVDKLLAEAGYDYQGNRSVTPYIFYGDRVEMDAEYFARTSGVDIYDVNAQKVLERMYVADEEWAEVLEKDENGYYTEKYGVEVWLVEEAEGFAYCARADKSGSTTITIPEYPVSSGGTITVNIPVVIQAVSQEGGTDSTIESTTDNSIVIDNSNSVLPVGTVLQSAKLESGDVYNNAEKIVKENVDTLVKYAVYELDLTDGNGAEINQLNGKVSVTMNVPFTMSENTVLKVYRVDNGTLVNCPATVSNGKVTFETDHFSTYIFAEETATVVTAPDTSDNSSIVTFVLLMVAGISLCGVAVFGKKYKITE